MNGVEVRGTGQRLLCFLSRSWPIRLTKSKPFLMPIQRPAIMCIFSPMKPHIISCFNRTNPTRYAYAWWAITTEHRRELAADLEKNKPRYIIYSLNTWRYDGIAEDQHGSRSCQLYAAKIQTDPGYGLVSDS